MQNSKGGGLASNFSGAGQVMGVRKTADFLEKSTWTLAVALVLFCVVAVAAIPHVQDNTQQSRIQEQVQRTTSGVVPTPVPDVPEGTEETTPTETPAETPATEAQASETPAQE